MTYLQLVDGQRAETFARVIFDLLRGILNALRHLELD